MDRQPAFRGPVVPAHQLRAAARRARRPAGRGHHQRGDPSQRDSQLRDRALRGGPHRQLRHLVRGRVPKQPGAPVRAVGPGRRRRAAGHGGHAEAGAGHRQQSRGKLLHPRRRHHPRGRHRRLGGAVQRQRHRPQRDRRSELQRDLGRLVLGLPPDRVPPQPHRVQPPAPPGARRAVRHGWHLHAGHLDRHRHSRELHPRCLGLPLRRLRHLSRRGQHGHPDRKQRHLAHVLGRLLDPLRARPDRAQQHLRHEPGLPGQPRAQRQAE